ncbi:hypothetical protein [uncultured Kordia sp.]|uniref:hypothetical protein n=1 Tax=uncultured Kordia sp. TaxID=507699 RepID=UPI0026043C8B|nr:hypothetical protein [uncultured Kordia sp.]
MSDIHRIYHNDIGISFQWKQDIKKNNPKFQVIFRDTGFYLTIEEIENFSKFAKQAVNRGCCKDCKAKNNCRSILLKTPATTVDLAVSEQELKTISDLIEGTLFQIKLNEYLKNICER